MSRKSPVWDFNCPQYVNFFESPKDDNLEEYFAVSHEQSPFQFDAVAKPTTSAPSNPRKSEASKKRRSKRLSHVTTPVKSTFSPVTKKLRLLTATAECSPDVVEVRKSLRHSSSFRVEVMKPRSVSVQENTTTVSTNRKRAASTRAEPIQAKRVTRTEPFKFSVLPDRRTKGAPTADVYKPIDFKATLRSNAAQANTNFKLPVTKVVPFRMADCKKRKREDAIPFVSMAEQIKRFESKTPDRFKIRPRSVVGGSAGSAQTRCTIPITPSLRALTRHRPVLAISQQEKEAQLAEDIKSYHFKANPIDPRIFAHTIGIKKGHVKTPTKPLDIKMNIDQRILARPYVAQEEDDGYEFKARPAPKKILQGIVGVPDRYEKPPTVSKSPAFASKMLPPPKRNVSLTTTTVTKPLRPIRRLTTQVFAPHLTDKKVTEPKPFSFHDKDIARWHSKEERIQREIQEEGKVMQFMAQPLPSPSVTGLPEKKKARVTQPDPFQLNIDRRGQKMAEKWQREVEEELRKQKVSAMFKAQPNEVIYKHPFVPAKPQKTLLEVSSLCLNTDLRAAEREKFEETKREREAQLAELKDHQLAAQEEADRLATLELRNKLVHKAQPVKHYQPVVIKPSEKCPTVPKTPNFRTDFRLRSGKENI